MQWVKGTTMDSALIKYNVQSWSTWIGEKHVGERDATSSRSWLWRAGNYDTKVE
jgi:hypothetical protein